MAGQYEDAFSHPRLQSWTVPRPPPKLPTPRPPTPFIADDRGHLLPHVPRSKVSPWGTFLGTWAMPARIPPARLDRSARSPGAAQRLEREQPPALRRACNGIRTRVTGKVTPWGHTGTHLGHGDTPGDTAGDMGTHLGTQLGHGDTHRDSPWHCREPATASGHG
ncbi:protein Flattop [Agelaius phoeniceus]|uniref:protein Flattop n=1 Tax=Agelaius phoeniceus TaxID=39638 RepID=UPI004054DAE4